MALGSSPKYVKFWKMRLRSSDIGVRVIRVSKQTENEHDVGFLMPSCKQPVDQWINNFFGVHMHSLFLSRF